jgi:hypothetical protein
MPSSFFTVWLALTITPLRHTMPLDGMRRRAWIATTELPAVATAAASWEDSSASALWEDGDDGDDGDDALDFGAMGFRCECERMHFVQSILGSPSDKWGMTGCAIARLAGQVGR